MKLPHRILNKYFPQRIWHQIFAILVFLVIVPLTILGVLLIGTSKKSIKTTVLRDQKEIAIQATGQVYEYVTGARESLTVVASILGTLQADTWRQETTIVALALRNSSFNRISSLDVSGQELVSSELGDRLVNRSEDPAFIAAIQNKSYISDVQVSDDYVPHLIIAEPIRQMGKVEGVLLADISLRSIWDIIDNIRLGQSGKAYLINKDGLIIAHPDKKLVLRNYYTPHKVAIENIISGEAGNIEELDQGGEAFLISYAPVKGLNWGLVVSQPRSEALAFSRTMQMQSWVLIFLSVLATVFISFILAYQMGRPAKTLIQATEHIADKDFDYHLKITRRDEVGKLYRAFNQMIAKLKTAQRTEKLSTIGSAATAIAHELKNSLVSVDTYIQLLSERHEDKKFIQDFSNTVPKELESWKNMLQNMIDYSKYLKFSVSHVDINSLVTDIAQLARHRAKQKGVHFVIETNKLLPIVNGNETKLKQVFLNLINNALDATPRGGEIRLTTDVITESDVGASSHVCIQIADSGEGIEKDRLKHVFEPFYSTKSEGLGLGLSISQEIMKLHGGSIDVNSEINKGTSFDVRIPTGHS